MNRHIALLSAIVAASSLFAQSLTMRWTLVQNDIEPGILEAQITLTNNTSSTLTAKGGWLIGYCQMTTHPYYQDGDALRETEVCGSYHTLTPTDAFLPLAPGESHIYRLYQRGSVIRENGAPEGAFFVSSPGAKPLTVKVLTEHFNSPLQWTRESNPGYADGAWMYAYNEPWCRALSAPVNADGTAAEWSRPLHLVPEPKSVTRLSGAADFDLEPVRKQVKGLPDEGYRLTLSPKKIVIEASSEAGFFYGEQTLERLRENGEALPSIRIEDWPDLPHRGVMLDIVRNYTPASEIKKILGVMAAYKMNVLHFHIADDEGWRLEIPGLPELTEVASRRGYTTDEHDCLYPSYCGGWDKNAPSAISSPANPAANTANGYLTGDDYIDLVRYADSLHITVLPEIEMPGHSRAAIRAMEERYRRLLPVSDSLANEYRLIDPADTSRYSSAQHYTDDVICIARPSAYHFVEKVLTEIIAMHDSAGQPLSVMHVGGDEVAKGAWEGSPLSKRVMREKGYRSTYELKDAFLSQILDFLRPQGIRLAGWEEIAMRGKAANPAFAGNDVISWCWNSIPEWAGDEKPYLLANTGYPVVLACVGNLYLDMSYTNHEQERALHWGGYTDEHSTFDFLPYDIYRSVRTTMDRQPRDIDAYDATKKVRLNDAARPKIVGIQGQIFAETLRSAEQMEQYLFPKMPGLAERAWNATPISYRAARLRAMGKPADMSYAAELKAGILAVNTAEDDDEDVAAERAEGVNTAFVSVYTTSPDRQALQAGRKAFEKERLLFSQQLYQYELPRLSGTFGVRFHLAQPGIIVKEEAVGGSFLRTGAADHSEKMVIINCPVPGATIRYTLDGTEPTSRSTVYQQPFLLHDGDIVRARAFYLGEESNTTRLLEE